MVDYEGCTNLVALLHPHCEMGIRAKCRNSSAEMWCSRKGLVALGILIFVSFPDYNCSYISFVHE